MSDDDHEEETLQSDAETAKKVTINETHTLLSIVTTGKAQRFIQDTHAPLHDESVVAVRDKFPDVSDEKVSAGQPQHDDQSNQYDHDEANLDQPCGQRDCVFSLCTQTLALRCTTSV